MNDYGRLECKYNLYNFFFKKITIKELWYKILLIPKHSVSLPNGAKGHPNSSATLFVLSLFREPHSILHSFIQLQLSAVGSQIISSHLTFIFKKSPSNMCSKDTC